MWVSKILRLKVPHASKYLNNDNSAPRIRHSMRRCFGILLLVLAAAISSAQSTSIEILYIANGMNRSGKGGAITAYRIDRNTGALTPVIGSPFSAAIIPYALATDNGKNLYATHPALDDDNLRVYPIRPDTGRLEFEHTSTFEGSNYEMERNCCPGPIVVDRQGRFAHIGNVSGRTISTYEIFPGSLAMTRTSTATTRPGHFPVEIVWGPDQSSIFARTDTGLPISLLHAFTREAQKGALKEATGSPLRVPNLIQIATAEKRKLLLAISTTASTSQLNVFSIGPDAVLTPVLGTPFTLASPASAFTVHPSGDFLAITSTTKPDNLASLSLYKLSSENRLTAPLSSLPLPCAKDCKITSLTFDLSGKFLYLADDSRDQLLGFSFDAAKPSLKAIPGSPWNSGFQPHSLFLLEPR